MYNPHQITKEFESALCEYTGARYAVAVNSCTMALLLAVAWCLRLQDWQSLPLEVRKAINIPKRTYVSVPMSIIHAGGRPTFRDEEWSGVYQLYPLPVWDSARRFTWSMWTDMHIYLFEHPMMCVSFHATKVLGDTQGGAILHDNDEADAWFRRARFDGRTEGVAPKDDKFDMIGWHCYISPDVSARLLWAMQSLPRHNKDLPNDDYPDLSLHEAFK